MAKAALTLDQVKNFCVFDGKPIPLERVKRNAVTCSRECAKAIERQRMLLLEQRECKYCRRPSTPEEREEFKRFRKWEKEQATAESTKEVTDKDTEESKSDYWTIDCKNCGRMRVEKTGICEKCGFDNKLKDADLLKEYPYVYTRFNSKRKGQRCRIVNGKYQANHFCTQIQFEDGYIQDADKINLSSGRPTKYSEKRGRPRKNGNTLSPKHQQEANEGE